MDIDIFQSIGPGPGKHVNAIAYSSRISRVTSNLFTSSLAVGADIMILRALGLMNPSSTALSINESKEL